MDIEQIRAMALEMDEGLGSVVEQFAKELHVDGSDTSTGGKMRFLPYIPGSASSP